PRPVPPGGPRAGHRRVARGPFRPLRARRTRPRGCGACRGRPPPRGARAQHAARRRARTAGGALMFTGLVQAVGRIAASEKKGDGLRIALDIGMRDVADVAIGDSIAINGCCLTIVAVDGSTLTFDVSAETLACTTGLDRVGDVNVEMALRLADRLGGHLMTGHVDGVGTVK